MTDEQIKRWLTEAETIAVVGCSDRPERTSYGIAQYLQRIGYRIIPVNPNIDSTLGEKSYPSILDLPKEMKVDIIDIFRNKKYTGDMVDQVINWSGASGKKPLVWTQIGVSSDSAKQLANDHEFPYVEDRCIMVEHRKLVR